MKVTSVQWSLIVLLFVSALFLMILSTEGAPEYTSVESEIIPLEGESHANPVTRETQTYVVDINRAVVAYELTYTELVRTLPRPQGLSFENAWKLVNGQEYEIEDEWIESSLLFPFMEKKVRHRSRFSYKDNLWIVEEIERFDGTTSVSAYLSLVWIFILAFVLLVASILRAKTQDSVPA